MFNINSGKQCNLFFIRWKGYTSDTRRLSMLIQPGKTSDKLYFHLQIARRYGECADNIDVHLADGASF